LRRGQGFPAHNTINSIISQILSLRATILDMDIGLTGSAMEDWWEKVSAVPTLLVGNATFLRDSPPPILPQWKDERHLMTR